MTAEEDREERSIGELHRSMEKGFERVNEDLGELKADVKKINEQAIPHRVKVLEKWRDRLGSRLWTFLIGTGTASVAAWASVLVSALVIR